MQFSSSMRFSKTITDRHTSNRGQVNNKHLTCLVKTYIWSASKEVGIVLSEGEIIGNSEQRRCLYHDANRPRKPDCSSSLEGPSALHCSKNIKSWINFEYDI